MTEKSWKLLSATGAGFVVLGLIIMLLVNYVAGVILLIPAVILASAALMFKPQ